jgi:hypothetical protein
MAYCDYIAHLIIDNLANCDQQDAQLLRFVGPMRYDLDKNGSFSSTTKTIPVVDRNGKRYEITIAEAK